MDCPGALLQFKGLPEAGLQLTQGDSFLITTRDVGATSTQASRSPTR